MEPLKSTGIPAVQHGNLSLSSFDSKSENSKKPRTQSRSNFNNDNEKDQVIEFYIRFLLILVDIEFIQI